MLVGTNEELLWQGLVIASKIELGSWSQQHLESQETAALQKQLQLGGVLMGTQRGLPPWKSGCALSLAQRVSLAPTVPPSQLPQGTDLLLQLRQLPGQLFHEAHGTLKLLL